MINNHRISQLENEKDISSTHLTDIGKAVVDEEINESLSSKPNSFLGMMQIVTAHRWYINCTIPVNNDFKVTTIAMIDSGAYVNCIQKGLIPSSFFEKTTHIVKSASNHALDIKYKLSNTCICQSKVCIPHFFFLVKNQLHPPIILEIPFINAIYPFSNLNAKGFSTNYNSHTINFEFIIEPITRDINSFIHLKQKHIDFLQMEIYSMNISESI